MKSHRTCSPDKYPSLPSLWAFALKEEWLEQCPYNTGHQHPAELSAICSVLMRGHFPFLERMFYKPHGPFQVSHPPGTPSNASQNQILQNTGLLVMPPKSYFPLPIEAEEKNTESLEEIERWL